MQSAVETTDIFRGAFFLLNGGKLSDVRLGDNNRGIVSFLIEGDDIARLDLDYRTGQALVNPLEFRETLNHMRDILFKQLRDGRTRYDRKRKDRSNKKRR